jgi:uncharacterized protein (DUF983 family)
VAPGATTPQVAAAVPVAPEIVGVTVTAFAGAPGVAAVFRTFAVSATTCPATYEAAGCAANATDRPAAAWTVVAGVVVAAAVSAAPVPAAVPFAVAVNVIVPEPDTVQLYVYGCVAPAVIAVAPGVTAPQIADAVPVTVLTDAFTVTPFAVAPPAAAVFSTFTVSATTCPVTYEAAGCAANATDSPAAAWTVVAGFVVTVAVSTVPVPADVPFAVAVNLNVPAPFTVQLNTYA